MEAMFPDMEILWLYMDTSYPYVEMFPYLEVVSNLR
jgi:hypothetical protein